MALKGIFFYGFLDVKRVEGKLDTTYFGLVIIHEFENTPNRRLG